MGDDGHMYVPQTLLQIYQNEIIPLCDICTPNQFEVELLTGQKIKNEVDAWTAMQWFHERGVRTVAISSTSIDQTGHLMAFLSHKNGTNRSKYTIKIPVIGNGITFTGAGDLFASLFLAHSSLKSDLSEAFEHTVASLQAVLRNTFESIPEEKRSPGKVNSRLRELKLIQSKADLENPNVVLRAKKETSIEWFLDVTD